MADKVPVRPGWCKMSDGTPVRVGRPDAHGTTRPGDYLFHKVVGAGAEATIEYLGDDAEDEAFDTEMIRLAIRAGHLTVIDKKHPRYVLNVDPPAAPKKSARQGPKAPPQENE